MRIARHSLSKEERIMYRKDIADQLKLLKQNENGEDSTYFVRPILAALNAKIKNFNAMLFKDAQSYLNYIQNRKDTPAFTNAILGGNGIHTRAVLTFAERGKMRTVFLDSALHQYTRYADIAEYNQARQSNYSDSVYLCLGIQNDVVNCGHYAVALLKKANADRDGLLDKIAAFEDAHGSARAEQNDSLVLSSADAAVALDNQKFFKKIQSKKLLQEIIARQKTEGNGAWYKTPVNKRHENITRHFLSHLEYVSSSKPNQREPHNRTMNEDMKETAVQYLEDSEGLKAANPESFKAIEEELENWKSRSIHHKADRLIDDAIHYLERLALQEDGGAAEWKERLIAICPVALKDGSITDAFVGAKIANSDDGNEETSRASAKSSRDTEHPKESRKRITSSTTEEIVRTSASSQRKAEPEEDYEDVSGFWD